MRRADRTAVYGHVLRINVYRAALHRAVAGDNARIRAQNIQFNKARRVQKQCDALSCKELARLLLLCAELRVALQNRILALANDGHIAFHIHVFPSCST